MSGGSLDYVYRRVDDAADSISATTPQRKAFVELLRRVAVALHDIEWVDSGDWAKGDENDAINACFNFDVAAETLIACHESFEQAGQWLDAMTRDIVSDTNNKKEV